MKPMKYILTLFILLLTFGSAQAQARNATLDVFASQTAVQAGQTFDIAIRQNIRDGWHTYWKNAGDSGEPTTIEWDLPEGVTISEIRFPTPKKIFYDPLVNYGFEGAPIYLQTVTVNEDFAGESLTLNGEAFWLICKEICIPESQDIALTLPVGDGGQPANQAIFDSAFQAMPQPVDWPTELTVEGESALLAVQMPEPMSSRFTDVEIYPYDWGIMATTDRAVSDMRDNGLVIFSKVYDGRALDDIQDLRFVLKTDTGAWIVTAATANASSALEETTSLGLVIVFAFLGGVILNLMPCVFPVLSMKALSLVKLSSKERRHAQASGLAYTAGIIVSFLLIAGALIAFREAGEAVGWGFQLQNPYIITALATLLFLITLNLSGFFEISGRFVNMGSRLTGGNDLKSSFFTGVLACIVATPCSAPFMASALGYAMTQPTAIALIVFTALGLGLAFPYLLLCYIPAVQRVLPKPGTWMETFRQFLAFPMAAAVAWLVWVLAQQSGDLAVLYILALFVAVAFLIWLMKRTIGRILKIMMAVIVIFPFIGYAPHLSTQTDTMAYQSYSRTTLDATLADNPDRPVFVNMTAAWCITCLMNERTSLSTEAVQQAFADHDVLYIKGDWTNRNDEITKYLESYGRNGVPLYVYYGKAKRSGERPQPVILPQILTPQIVINTIEGVNEP